ncbi:MAG TPA: xanthine dehydrogenase family protein molybdopterin-binding subunit [Candidatus Dormibacteraeota bacterium]
MRRIEGAPKVSGALVFTEDMELAGLLHAKLVLSYVASARIAAVRADAARAVPGVVAVVTGADLGLSEDHPDQPMAAGRVFYAGQPVAAVLATSAAAAADAAAQVEVEYSALPAALGVEAAVREDAPRVLPEQTGDADEASIHGAASSEETQAPEPVGNITGWIAARRGDLAAGRAAAAATVRRTYSMPRVHHAYLEPHVVAARVDRDGMVTVWSPTQGAAEVIPAVAKALGVGAAQVRVVPMPVGGGFGGKWMQLEPLVAVLAGHAGRPVRLQLTRNEEFLLGRPAPASQVTLELGATREGDLTLLQAEVDYDNGATSGWHGGITAELLVSSYRVPNFEVGGREVATNLAPVTAYRAPGAPQAYFALESALDELAGELGIDPLELRLRSAARAGDPRGDGSPWPRIGLVECLEAARRHPAYTAPRAPGEGVGVAVGSWIGAFGPAAAACRMDSDGNLLLHLGSTDISGSDTGFAALAAEVFGIAPERVRIQHTDSTTSPESPGAGGSATTYSVAPAVERAVLEARRQVLEAAGSLLEASAADLELAGGQVQVKGVPARAVTLQEVVDFAQKAGGPGPISAIGRVSQPDPGPMFCVHIARVRVDDETGQVEVTRYAAIHDIGRALDRALVNDQVYGGVVQGLGRALSEELVYDDGGQLRTASFADYGLPTGDQVPPIDVELVEVPSEHGALGSRGIGEPPIVPGLAAIANAIEDAVGVRMTAAPFTPESVLDALRTRAQVVTPA